MAGLGLVDIQPSVDGSRHVPAGTLCKALHCGNSRSFINKLTNQFNEMWST